jgi:hypothetical protein
MRFLADYVHIGELGPIEPPARSLQRLLVSSILLRSGDGPHGHRSDRRAS